MQSITKSMQRTNRPGNPRRWSLLILTAAALMTGCTANTVASEHDLPFTMPALTDPAIPNRTFTITDFGAVGDGRTKNTRAFERAIRACADAGGGRIVVPAGLWLTGPIQLKSNLELHLQQGAVILFSPDIDDYPLVRKTFEGSEAVRRMSPLTGIELENIALTGSGVFDGSGQVWRPVKKFKMTDRQWKQLLASGGVVDDDAAVWYPSRRALEGPQTVAELNRRRAETSEYAAAAEFLRPTLVSLVKCRNVLLDGPTFRNSPAWNIHPLLCENMIIRNITVLNPWWSQNGDGLDLESCKNVLVHNCRFDVGDDAICLKSGRDEYGRRRGAPVENVIIRDCTVYHGHGGFVVGSEMSGGVRNILVQNCDFLGTDVGVRFKSTRGRGGIVENIHIRDIRMKDIAADAVLFDLFYASQAPTPEQTLDVAPEPVSEKTPRFQNIYLNNIFCSGAANAVYIQGLPEMSVQNVQLENLVISADAGVTAVFADGVTFKNASILPKNGPPFMLYACRNWTLDNVSFPESDKTWIRLAGEKTDAVRLKNITALPDGKLEFKNGATPAALIRE